MDAINCPDEVYLVRFNGSSEMTTREQANRTFEPEPEEGVDRQHPSNQVVTSTLTSNGDQVQNKAISHWLKTSEKSKKKTLSHSSSSSSMTYITDETLELSADYREPFEVVWSGLNFEVENRLGFMGRVVSKLTRSRQSYEAKVDDELHETSDTGKRSIFSDLNGSFKSGELTAIIGPSGAGKTSLLNAIVGFTAGYSGQIQLRGAGNRRMSLSVIPQKDHLIENLTVRESLLFGSKMLHPKVDFDHETTIIEVAEMLNLTHCLDVKTGNISGGEYKRTSIAQELLRRPDILVLDEPTSGLDSLSCKRLIELLRRLLDLSRKGVIKSMAILMTIHQPDIEVFQSFDQVYCMARRGRVIFDGQPNVALDTIRQVAGFEESEMPVGLAPNDSLKVNPANLLIELASELVFGQAPIDRLSEHQRIQAKNRLSQQESNILLSSPQFGKLGQNKLLVMKPVTDLDQSKTESLSPSQLSSQTLVRDKRLRWRRQDGNQFWRHTNLLTRRALRASSRDPMLTVIALIYHLLVPFVMWSVYPAKVGQIGACPLVQREMDIMSLLSNRTEQLILQLQDEVYMAIECSTMFFLTIYSFSMCWLSVAALAFPLNMHILLKEVRNGWYKMPSYVVANTLASIPFEVLLPAMSVALMYLLLGLPPSYYAWRMWSTAGVMVFVSMISHSQGLIFGALFMNSVETSVFVASASTLPMIMLSGFTARVENMPAALQSFTWLSLYKYASRATALLRFGFDTCPCDESTVDYLAENNPYFRDMSRQLSSTLNFYMQNSGKVPNSTEFQETIPLQPFQNTSNHSLVTDYLPYGIVNTMLLTPTEKDSIYRMVDSGEVNIIDGVAAFVSKMYAYGRNIYDCSTIRSQFLKFYASPDDEDLKGYFLGLLILLLAAKLILFLVVRHKIVRLV